MDESKIRVIGSFNYFPINEYDKIINNFCHDIIIPENIIIQENINNLNNYLLRYCNKFINNKYSFDILNYIFRLEKEELTTRFLILYVQNTDENFVGTWIIYNSYNIEDPIMCFDKIIKISTQKIPLNEILNIQKGTFSIGSIMNYWSNYFYIFKQIATNENIFISTVFSASKNKMYILLLDKDS